MSEPIGRLILQDCSISDGTVFETFLGLTADNFLTVLDLSGTKLGHNAMHISSIVAHGNLKQLHLPHCEIPETALDFILPLLPCCKELTHLNLYGNNLEACGHHVADFIMASGDKPTLKELNLGHCSMTREACMKLLFVLGNCKSLTTLNLTGNSIQGCLDWFLPHPHEGLHSFGKLFLESTSLNCEDMSHLVLLIEKRKLPMLEELNLASNALHTMETEVENLVGACVTHHIMELKVNLCDNDLSDSFEDKCKSLCEGTSIELCGIRSTHLVDLPWTEDEFLQGFYDDEESDGKEENEFNNEVEEDKAKDEYYIDDEQEDYTEEDVTEGEKDNEEDDDEIGDQDWEEKNKDYNREQDKEEVVMGKNENKTVEDDDKQEVNDTFKDMDNEKVNDEEKVQQEAQEAIHPHGPSVDRDEILEGFCDNYF